MLRTETWPSIIAVPNTIITNPPMCTSAIVMFDMFMPTLASEEVVEDHSTRPVVAMTGSASTAYVICCWSLSFRFQAEHRNPKPHANNEKDGELDYVSFGIAHHPAPQWRQVKERNEHSEGEEAKCRCGPTELNPRSARKERSDHQDDNNVFNHMRGITRHR